MIKRLPAPTLYSMHHDRNMIVHILTDIPQTASGDNADGAKRYANQIHPAITFREGLLPCLDDDGERGLVAGEAGDEGELVEQRSAGEEDGLADVGGVGDVEAERHGAADVRGDAWDKFINEDVVVGCIADAAADNADGER